MSRTKNKNKHRHPTPPQPSQAPGQSPAAAAVAFIDSPLPTSPRQAVAEIDEVYAKARDGATEADIERAASAAAEPEAAPIDLVAAAARVREALALCLSREERVEAAETATRKKEEALAERERRATEREAELSRMHADLETKRATLDGEHADLEKERARIAAEEKRVRAHEAKVLEDERRVRTRELNAEAGFAEERRASLRQLDAEAVALRKEISDARAAMTNDRAAWEARRRADDEKLRAERDARRAAHERELEAERAGLAQEIRAEREKLAGQRGEQKKRAAQLDMDRELLAEDRAAFEARVERRAAALLEEARAQNSHLEAQLTAARQDRDRLFERLRSCEDAESLHAVKTERDALVRERDALKQELAARPSAAAAARLQELEKARERWEDERHGLTQQAMELKSTLARASIAVTELETLRDQKAALESSRDLLQAAIDELRKDVDERIRRVDGVNPFPACAKMDADPALQTGMQVIEEIPDLAVFCDDLRQRIALDPATGKQLYYSPADVRCFLAGLAMSRLHLLHGISGTGKTSLPLAFARAVGAGCTLIEVQAGWRDRADLLGHYNAFERRFYESELLQALYRAQCPAHAGRPYIVVLDEMNLSHPEQYFADFLSALEQDAHLQKLDLMTAEVSPAPALLRDGRTLAIPQNVWFVGTANHDETTKDFADKTYDRAHVMALPRHREEFAPRRLPVRPPVGVEALSRAFQKAREGHQDEARTAYQFLDERFAQLLGSRFRVGWGNRLERQMAAFVPVVIAAGGRIGEAVDHVLATKLLRKIRDRHDTRVGDLEALRKALSEAWPELDTESRPAGSLEIVRDELRRLGAEGTDEDGG